MFKSQSSKLERATHLKKIFSRCANRYCPNNGRRWPGLLRKGEGILLQGLWHCSLDCFEKTLLEKLVQGQPPTTRPRRKVHRIPLGLLLLSNGVISDEKLKAALKAQRESGKGRVGDWLRQFGVVTEQQITAALGTQWSCPVFPLENRREFLECASLVPLPILEPSRMVTVHYLPSSRLLYVAFADWIDYTTLYAIEQMLECRTEPCLAKQTALESALEEIRSQPRPPEVMFDSVCNPQEIAHTARSYVTKLGIPEVRMVVCWEHLWVRLQSPSQTTNLLFRLASDMN